MTTNITREAVTAWLDETPDVSPSAARMIRALRTALDEAERVYWSFHSPALEVDRG